MLSRIPQRRLLIDVSKQYLRCSVRNKALKEVRFSETSAYHGLDKTKNKTDIYSSAEPLYIPNKYDTEEFRNKRLFYAIGSVTILGCYLAFIREPNDIDIILEAPPHVVAANFERRMLREKMEQSRIAGQSTDLLQAELDYVDVKEAALKAQYEKKQKNMGR